MRGLLAVLSLSIFCGCTSIIRADESNKTEYAYRAAAGSVKITPEKNSFMGGYRVDPPRVAEGVHDDLYARCLVLEGVDGKKVIFVSLDLVAFLRHDVELIKSKLKAKEIDVGGLFITATHTHSGPDTIGIWGGPLKNGEARPAGGRDEEYMTDLRDKIVELVAKTLTNLKDADVYVTQTSGADLNRNDKPSGLDDKITTLFVKETGAYRLIGVLTNFGCHPETVGKKTLQYSADFPGELSQQLEKLLGCPILFVNGSLGGMVTVNPAVLENRNKCFAQTEEFAGKLAKKTIPPEISAKYYHRLTNKVEVAVTGLSLTLDNPALEEAMEKGIIPSTPTTYENSTVYAEVAVVTLGNFKIAMIPGEPTPDVGRNVKDIIGSDGPVKPAIFALANGEIGYILMGETYDMPCFEQEREKSLGRKTGDAILEAFKKLAAQ